jgi:hypothetical protein
MALSQKSVSPVGCLLNGAKNGQRIGIRLSTAVKDAREINEANNLCKP